MSENTKDGTSAEAEEPKSKNNIVRYTMIAAAGLGGVILLIFVVGVVLALLPNPVRTAARVQVIRDIFLILMGLESILIIFGLAALIIQVARLVNLLQNEVQPILKNTQETVNTAKSTAQFVGANVTEPVIKASAFMAGAGVFIREIGGIRRAIRPSRNHATKEKIEDVAKQTK